MDVGGHPVRIAADVEVGTFLKPGVEFRAFLDHLVLDIDLFRLVAGKGEVELGKLAVFQEILPLKLIEEIIGVALIAEEEPVFPRGTEGRTMLDEGAEGSDPCARPDHDNRCAAIRGEAEIFVRLHEDRDVCARLRHIAEIGRANTFP